VKKISKNLLSAIRASLEAGKKILEVYHSDNFELEFKNDSSPLTKADLLSNAAILKVLNADNSIPILSEEGKKIDYNTRKEWKKLWIIDPLDGTKEFVKRNDEFTVNIALVENQIPVLGVIYVPVTRDLYFSEKKIGSYKMNMSNFSHNLDKLIESSTKLPIDSDNTSYTIVASRSHMSLETEQFIKDKKKKYDNIELISRGSSLKLCMVAEGKANCYPRYAPTMEWDTAAGHAICLNAGFNVIDYVTKKPMIYNRENLLNNWFIVE
tara:strand:- start:705 stop:1505 length:801 start_codon:yes stop_codon:yes gene_type:complete